jgi:hypothetical protein
MVIVSHLWLNESILLPSSTLNASLNLLNIPEEIISEKGPFHSNLLTLFDENYKDIQLEAGKEGNDTHNNNNNNNNNNNHNNERKLEKENDLNNSGSFWSSIFYYAASPFSSNSDKPSEKTNEVLATTDWTIDSVYSQIYGLCVADSTWLNPIEDLINELSPSAFSSSDKFIYNDDHLYQYESNMKNLVPKKSNSKVIFMSHPKEFDMYSGLTLKICENKKISFSLVLPTSEIPPSYKGALLKYLYFLAVSIQVSNKKKGVFTKVMTIPFKIRNPIASIVPVASHFGEKMDFQWRFHDEIKHRTSHYTTSSNGNFAPSESDSILKNGDSDENFSKKISHSSFADLSNSSFYYPFHAINSIISAHAKTNVYEITDDDKRVCQFSLSNTAFCIGDTLLGIFDFSCGQITCLKVNIELIYEELFAKRLYKDENFSNSYTNSQEDYYTSLGSKISRFSVGYFSKYTLNTLTTEFNMMIPPHAPAQFCTELVNVNWYLKFTFYLIKQGIKNADVVYTTQILQEKKDSIEVDILEWKLPIQVFVPTHFRPLHTQSLSREMCMLCYHE